jgi:hypothetical protein
MAIAALKPHLWMRAEYDQIIAAERVPEQSQPSL